MHKPEILAPAGGMDSLTAALRCGADAVYIGGKSFSARQNAANFNTDEIKQAAQLCHLYGKKLYLTVNTIIFDAQTNEFARAIEDALSCGIDAFIVQDWGAAEIIKTVSQDAVLHASTQMTVHSPSGALLAKEMGFKRVVLARELSQKQISEISAMDIETEIFVHGALCMSVSGQCYMSAVIGQRSANRGLCAQPCRLPFSATGKQDFCGLSLKDLSLTEHVDAIKNMGVSSLKIEGRMKRPEYVAAAVSAFRNAVDGQPVDTEMLRAVFSRSGFTDGYFTGKYSNMFGTRQKEDVTSAKTVIPEIHGLYRAERKVTPVSFDAEIKAEKPVLLKASDGDGNCVTVSGDIPQAAINKPCDSAFLERQLSKLGDTVFSFGKITADIGDGLALSAGSLNELRRNAVSQLSEKRIAANTPLYRLSGKLPLTSECVQTLTEIRARISDISQVSAAVDADRIIIPLEILFECNVSDISKIIIEPPRFITDENTIIEKLEKAKMLGISDMMCNNAAYLTIGKKLGFNLHGDFGMNVSNSISANALAKLGMCDITLSFELKLSQAEKIKSPVKTGIIAYGRLPLMLTKNCPVKNETGCVKCRKTLIDRTGRECKIECHDKDYVEILNSQRLYLADRLSEIRNTGFMTLYFTDETAKSVSEIINSYRTGSGKQENITRGLCYRGVM